MGLKKKEIILFLGMSLDTKGLLEMRLTGFTPEYEYTEPTRRVTTNHLNFKFRAT